MAVLLVLLVLADLAAGHLPGKLRDLALLGKDLPVVAELQRAPHTALAVAAVGLVRLAQLLSIRVTALLAALGALELRRQSLDRL